MVNIVVASFMIDNVVAIVSSYRFALLSIWQAKLFLADRDDAERCFRVRTKVNQEEDGGIKVHW